MPQNTPLKGCSYGDDQARLGGITRIGEIPPSLKKLS